MGIVVQKAALMRRATEFINLRGHEASIPRVLWVEPGEAEEAFALRCAAVQNTGAYRILAAHPHGFRVPDGVRPVPIAPRHYWHLHPSRPIRFRAQGGGRGSAKSISIALVVILMMLERPLRVLATREYQSSLKESAWRSVCDWISELGLDAYFDTTDRVISCKVTGAEMIFLGIGTNPQSLKSLASINLAWCEEAESLTGESLEILIPTVRAEGSEVWFSFNPKEPTDAVMEFASTDRPDVRYLHTDWTSNPWFPAPLNEHRLYLERTDPDLAAHVYGGRCRIRSASQVFGGKYITGQTFEPDPKALASDSAPRNLPWWWYERNKREVKPLWQGPFVGADFGTTDPSCAVLCWISERKLYVEYEAYAVGCDIDCIPALFDQIPGMRNLVCRADSSRPDVIAYLQRHGFPRMVGVRKAKHSIAAGIAFLRSFEQIVVHERCPNMAEELRQYAWRTNSAGDFLPDPVDRFNHLADALRYALMPLIENRGAARTQSLASFFGGAGTTN